MHYIWRYNSPIGEVMMASNGESLIGLWLEGQRYSTSILEEECQESKLPIFEETTQWLNLYFSGKIPHFTPKLHLEGSSFQKAVWNILLQIPYGKVVSYKYIAQQIIRQQGLTSMSAQAVGGAVGRNPISIIVPCHRVVGSSGSLTGYAGGLSKKIELLNIEKIDMSGLFLPKSRTSPF